MNLHASRYRAGRGAWKLLAGLTLVLPLVLCGCQALALPFLLWGEAPTKTIPAEYPHLEGKKVAIIVWAEMDTLFEFPHVQLELSEHVRVALEAGVKGISFVPNREVIELQRRESGAALRPRAVELGKRLGAQRVVEIDLTQYTTREPDSPHLYRGHIMALVKVYDTAQADAGPTYRTEVFTAYPPDSVGRWGSDDRLIRRLTMEAFALDVAGRFYERKVREQ